MRNRSRVNAMLAPDRESALGSDHVSNRRRNQANVHWLGRCKNLYLSDVGNENTNDPVLGIEKARSI
jgi:hypothetical protein